MKKFIALMSIAAVIVSCIGVLAFAVGEKGETADIIKDGEAVYSIVYSGLWRKQADTEEFSDYTMKATGVEFPMYAAETKLGDKEIFIGSTLQAIGEHKKRIGEGGQYYADGDVIGRGYIITTFGERIIICTDSSTGVVRGLTYLFENGSVEGTLNSGEKIDSLSVPADIYARYSPYVECDLDAVMDIGGTDIGEYTVIYSSEIGPGDEANEPFFEAVNTIRRYIFGITGKVIPLKDDKSEPSEHEIVIGRTNRKDFIGLDENGYVISCENGKLYICGGNDYTTEVVCERFGSEYLKVTDAKYTGGSVISIPGDLDREEKISFAKATAEGADQVNYLCDNIDKLLGTKETPCFSDPATADAIYDAIIAERHRSGEEVSIICNRADWCGCEKCGGKTDAYFETVSKVAERLKENNLRVAITATNETRAPSVDSISDNVWIYFAEPHVCCAHALNDQSCEDNKKIAQDLEAWTKISGKVCVLDYTMNYQHYPSTFPDIHVLHPNFSYYSDIGVNGIMMLWKKGAVSLEFGEVRLALINALIIDPDMSDEEYAELEKSVIDGLYGDRADVIRKYIERFTAESAEHFTIFSKPSEILPIKRTGSGEGAQAYDLSLAKELAGLWESIYERHDPPDPPLTGEEMDRFEQAYYDSDYYLPLHSRVQFTEWVNGNIPHTDRYDVFSEIVSSYGGK